MTLVAAYIPKSGTAVLSPGGPTPLPFDFGGLPDHTLVNDCVLGFMVTDRSPGLQVRAKLNGDPIWTYSSPAGSGPKLFFQQVIVDNLKPAPAANKVTFEIFGGTGGMNIDEVVLWYRQDF